MNAEASLSVMRRMTRASRPVVQDVPLTASRAVRLATTRAAENSVGLLLTVSSVAEDTLSLDDLLATLSDDYLMVGLNKGGIIAGVMACDFQFSAAAVELRTMGSLSKTAPENRPVTGTDLKLTEPVLQRVLNELAITTPRTSLDGWADGVFLAERLRTTRRVGFELGDLTYRLIRLSVDVGVEGRQSTLMIALPLQTQKAKPEVETDLDWGTHFRAALMKAPVTLNTLLHKFQMPLGVATNLEIGQVVPLPGCTVGSVRLVSPDGRVVARGRLGQIAGQIAVRLQADDDTVLAEMSNMPGGLLGGGGGGGMLGNNMMGGGGMMGGLDDAPGGMMGGLDDVPGGMMGGLGDAPGGMMGGLDDAPGGMMDNPLGDSGEDGDGELDLSALGGPMAFDPDLASLGDPD